MLRATVLGAVLLLAATTPAVGQAPALAPDPERATVGERLAGPLAQEPTPTLPTNPDAGSGIAAAMKVLALGTAVIIGSGLGLALLVRRYRRRSAADRFTRRTKAVFGLAGVLLVGVLLGAAWVTWVVAPAVLAPTFVVPTLAVVAVAVAWAAES